MKKARSPKQERSILRKEKILESAYNLFCEKGYFNTTTNEIAKESRVQISSLYSYFKNKDDILFELLRKYNKGFLEDFNFKEYLGRDISSRKDIERLIRNVFTILIQSHKETREFNKELQALYYYNEEVKTLMDNHERKIQEICLKLLEKSKEIIKCDNLEITAFILVKLISLVVDEIVFNKSEIEPEQLIDEAIKNINKILF